MMSKLSELIEQLCPDGVEYKSIGSIITRVTEKGKDDTSVQQVYVVSNTQGLVRAEEYRKNTIHSEDTSNYTIVRKNMMAYNPSRLNIGSIAMLKNDTDGLVSPMYIVFSIDNSKVLYEYFNYVVKSSAIANKISSFKEEGARFRFDFSRWNWIDIPVPPLPIQEEIVRILDAFVQYSNVLTAELTARKKQYAFYLDDLFKNIDAPMVSLGELGTLTRGKRFVHADATESGVPCIHYGELYTYYGVYAEKVRSHIREELRPKMRYAHKGDVVIVGAGENNIDIGIGVAWEGDEDVAVHDACYTLCHSQNAKYISYYLRSNMYHNQITKYVSQGKICSISATKIGEALIPIPSLDEQSRIVSILDRFDSLCSDITDGLPAEIEARQKQYEYYRDKLLTFESAK